MSKWVIFRDSIVGFFSNLFKNTSKELVAIIEKVWDSNQARIFEIGKDFAIDIIKELAKSDKSNSEKLFTAVDLLKVKIQPIADELKLEIKDSELLNTIQTVFLFLKKSGILSK